MRTELLLKDAYQESALFSRRIVVALLFVTLSSGFLMSRLAYLQISQHTHYTTLSENNRLRVLPIPPVRGLIYDRNGVILAENRPTFSLEIIPEQAKRPLPELIAQLRRHIQISEYEEERFFRTLKQKYRFHRVPLRYQLSDREVARIAVMRHRFPGVHINAALSRYYPLGEYTAHTVGYVGRISETDLDRIDPINYSGTRHIGKTGIEKSYEDVLHGTVGHQQVEADVQGRVVRVIERKPPVAGKNLYLHLDIRLQRFVEDLLKDHRASLVAVDPLTGGVLALVSTPSFDPNLFVNGIEHETYRALSTSPDRPLFNRALQGQYPPGSTIKPFVGLAGLVSNSIAASNHVYCPGWYRLPGKEHRYRDWKRSGHGPMDLHHAIEQSCDVFFYELASRLGIDRMSGFLKSFAFGRKTGIDLDSELPGLMPTSTWKRRVRGVAWYPGETLISGIGQGFSLATPLQLAVATAALSRRGQMSSPRLGSFIDDDTRQEVVKAPPLTRVSLLHPEYWDVVIGAMDAVVHGPRGTARAQNVGISYRMAGKTGTAQVVRLRSDDQKNEDLPERHQDHALFIAFAPVEEARIALGVIVENGGSGGRTAAPIARQVIDYYLNDLREADLHANSTQ